MTKFLSTNSILVKAIFELFFWNKRKKAYQYYDTVSVASVEKPIS